MEIVQGAYLGQGLSVSQVYLLIKDIKEGKDTKDMRGKDMTKTVQMPVFIKSMRADVEADHCVTLSKLATSYAVSKQTIWNVLIIDLGLSKKYTHWDPKLLAMFASSAVGPSLTATRGRRRGTWTKSSPWTSLPCPTTPLRQGSS